jgi:predicted Zn-dependent protease
MRPVKVVACIALLSLAPPAAWGKDAAATPSKLLQLLGEELDHSMKKLAMPDGTKPYFLGYTVYDEQDVSIRATLGALLGDDDRHSRTLNVDVRVGDYDLDNTHKIRGGGYGFDPSDFLLQGGTELCLANDPDAIKHTLWLATDRSFKGAVKKFQRVQTNLKTKVEEEDKSGDFTREEPNVYYEPEVHLQIDRDKWGKTLRHVSKIALEHPLIHDSSVSLSGSATNRYMVTSEGTKLQTGRKLYRVVVTAQTKAEDGMELYETEILDAASEDHLPGEEEIVAAFNKVIGQVLALREAPLVEPYTGPAILKNRASGVFFHEIFGHRMEGHRQKDVDEGQTFTKKVGEQVLPEFITVRDDPTMERFGDVDLRGYYRYDDEGVAAEDVHLVENGVLKTFLMSRSPVENFPKSNGHGRRAPGETIVSRMGNTIIESSNAVTFDKLRELLIEECKKQDKPYGLLFEDISGGFTGTRRYSPQSFKVLPLLVYRVYPDGRPDELVRGVDIVGTPLTSFSMIIYTGDDPAVFNGTCGAESGMIPVSGISPSILVSQIEVEKRRREQDKPPILPPPIAERGEKTAESGR